MDHPGARRNDNAGVVLRIICGLLHVVVLLSVVFTLYMWWSDWRSARASGDDFLGGLVAGILILLCALDLVIVVVGMVLRRFSPSWLVVPIVALIVGCVACAGAPEDPNNSGALRPRGDVSAGNVATQ